MVERLVKVHWRRGDDVEPRHEVVKRRNCSSRRVFDEVCLAFTDNFRIIIAFFGRLIACLTPSPGATFLVLDHQKASPGQGNLPTDKSNELMLLSYMPNPNCKRNGPTTIRPIMFPTNELRQSSLRRIQREGECGRNQECQVIGKEETSVFMKMGWGS